MNHKKFILALTTTLFLATSTAFAAVPSYEYKTIKFRSGGISSSYVSKQAQSMDSKGWELVSTFATHQSDVFMIFRKPSDNDFDTMEDEVE